MINQVIVLGGGSAGFLAAIALRIRIPALSVTVIRSKDIGIIMVGEGSTQNMPSVLHGFLRIDPGEFYRMAQPTWKLGIRFLWGPRPYFDYTFLRQLDWKWDNLPRRNGFYCEDRMECVNMASSLMSCNNAFVRKADGTPFIGSDLAYHIENAKFVSYLEYKAAQLGVTIIDGTVTEVRQDEHGISALHLDTGQICSGDLYVDCSGFRSVLLGKALGEPFIDFKATLFCDRAVVGGWKRTDEPIKPYTTAETMDAGWAWQIEHEPIINRGYVYSSAFISDDDAEREFRTKNPKVQSTRIVKFPSGRYQRSWVKNVVGIGNAFSFVEPLEATALALILDQCRNMVEVLIESELNPTRPLKDTFNRSLAGGTDFVKAFLGVHYKFNTRLDTPFWRACREKVDIGPTAEGMLDYYQHSGPTIWGSSLVLGQFDTFGVDGFLCMFVGQKVPFHNRHTPTERERRVWTENCYNNRARAMAGLSVPEALALVRDPRWNWDPEFYPRMAGTLTR
jgi:tryptophan halogenase